MAIDTQTFARAVALWLMATSAGFTLVFLGASFAADRLPVDLPAPAVEDAGDRSAGGAGAPAIGPRQAYPAPDFRLSTLEGRRLGPTDFAGQVVVVELWASWCGPCRLQARILDQLHRRYQDREVHFLAVNSGEDETTVRAYLEKTPFPYPVLLDPRMSVQTRYRSNGLPTLMVVDRGGRVSYFNVGITDADTLGAEIDRALAAAQQRA